MRIEALFGKVFYTLYQFKTPSSQSRTVDPAVIINLEMILRAYQAHHTLIVDSHHSVIMSFSSVVPPVTFQSFMPLALWVLWLPSFHPLYLQLSEHLLQLLRFPCILSPFLTF